MNITLKTVDKQRYPTIGDYFKTIDGKDIITTLDTKVDIYNKLVVIHELIELICTEYHNISEEDITNYDITHLEYDEPGEQSDCPYRRDHLFAEMIERLICNHLDIDFKLYNDYIYEIYNKYEERQRED